MPENKDDIDLRGWDLHRAAWENYLDVARLLIEEGANTDGINLIWMDGQEDNT